MSVETRRYTRTYAALLLLAAASLAISFLPLGAWGLPVSLVIAAVKALLVARVFMHLAEGPFVYSLALGLAIGLLVLLTVLTAADVLTR
jgi:cytochrome c oxidase subunit 4